MPIKKYKVKNEISLKAENLLYDKLSDYVSAVIDVALENKVTEVKDFSFYVKNTKESERKALESALDNANTKASFIAKELGVALKNLMVYRNLLLVMWTKRQDMEIYIMNLCNLLQNKW